MRTYQQTVQLAQICARNSRITTDRETAAELWRMAKRYQSEAAKLDHGVLPEIGDPPDWLTE